MTARTTADQRSTRKVTVENILISYYGRTLDRPTIDAIAGELLNAMKNGPTAWAFVYPQTTW